MEKIDLNRATVDELDRTVEGIGPLRARYIVEDRERKGPFRSLDDVDRVDGIDDVMRAKIKQAAVVREERTTSEAAARDRQRAGRTERDAGEQERRRGERRRAEPGPHRRLDLNTATADELDRSVEGIGPERARYIVEDRQRRGPFRSLDDVDRVDGIDDVMRAKIKQAARVSGETTSARATEREPERRERRQGERRQHQRRQGDRTQAAAGQRRSGRVDLNTASVDELDQMIEGIGPERARYIVEDRERRGPFRTVGDIDRVDGIDDVLRAKIKEVATVGEEGAQPSA